MPLDLPAVAVVVGDPEQLHQRTDTSTTLEPFEVEQSPCRRSSRRGRGRRWSGAAHPGGRHRDRAETVPGGAVAVPLDLPAVAVAVGDPEHLHPGDRHRHLTGTPRGGAVAVPLDLPAVAVAVGDPEQLTQGDDSKTTMEQSVEQSPCR